MWPTLDLPSYEAPREWEDAVKVLVLLVVVMCVAALGLSRGPIHGKPRAYALGAVSIMTDGAANLFHYVRHHL
jgi:hypothetical protein